MKSRGYLLPKGCKDLNEVLNPAPKRRKKLAPLRTHQEVRTVIGKYMPEFADGSCEIVSLARVVGRRCLLVVRPKEGSGGRLPRMERGAALNAMIEEMGGEMPSMTRWESSAEEMIRNVFLSPALRVELDASARRAVVKLNEAVFEELTRDHSAITRDAERRMHSEMAELVAEVTGWSVRMDSPEGES